jgi:hypothetical protein
MKKIFTTMILFFILGNSAFASSRVNETLSEDAKIRLDNIEKTKSELAQYKEALITITDQLNKELVIAGKQDIFIQRRNLALKTFIISVPTYLFVELLGARHIGPASKFTTNAFSILTIGLGLAGISSPIIAAGMEAGVLLNNNDAVKLKNELATQKDKINNAQSRLNAEIVFLCKSEENHKLCYSVSQD